MKIALIGYGKMGKEIEKAAIDKGHEISMRLTSAEMKNAVPGLLANSDVAIEFTRPDAAYSNIKFCFDAGIPVVVGTTGWYEHLDEVKSTCEAGGKAILYASNFSLGVNILFEINRKLAKIMNQYPQYDVMIDEIHHTKKLDAPSGTAISLANGIIENIDRKNKWVNDDQASTDKSSLKIHSERIGEVSGTHIVKYISGNDVIELHHDAFNRSGFATGAVMAAEWIFGKTGCYTMNDVLMFNA